MIALKPEDFSGDSAPEAKKEKMVGTVKIEKTSRTTRKRCGDWEDRQFDCWGYTPGLSFEFV